MGFHFSSGVWKWECFRTVESQQVESSRWMDQQQKKRDGPVRCVCEERRASEHQKSAEPEVVHGSVPARWDTLEWLWSFLIEFWNLSSTTVTIPPSILFLVCLLREHTTFNDLYIVLYTVHSRCYPDISLQCYILYILVVLCVCQNLTHVTYYVQLASTSDVRK